MSFYERMKQIKTTNPFFSKDLAKAKNATKFIGRGSLASSTNKYREAAQELANSGFYTQDDIVFVSAEGMRRGREEVDFDEILKAVNAGVTFITDNVYDRTRPYNMGERQVAFFLKKHGYEDNDTGVWKKTK